MTIKVGINGFGRIGRSIFRIIAERPDLELVAINDISSKEALAYLLKFDTVMGTFPANIVAGEDGLAIDDEWIPIMAESEPANLRWSELGVQVVVEATGKFRERADLIKHLGAGAKRVLLTVPPKDPVDAMVVIGVNDDELNNDHRIVSNASCTTNCLAPLAKVLDDEFVIQHGLMTTVHAYTNDQRLADVPHQDLRRSRAAAENIIPTTTGAARAVSEVMPQLHGKLDGMAARVPVPDGSLIDFTVKLDKSPGVDDINSAMERAASGPMAGIVEYNTSSVVSSDVVGNPHSSIFDALLTQVQSGGYARVISWYDNEWGYSNRCVDLIEKLAALDATGS